MNQMLENSGASIPNGSSADGEKELLRALETTKTLRRTYDELLTFLNELQTLQEQETPGELFNSYCDMMGRIVPLRHISIFTMGVEGELALVPDSRGPQDQSMVVIASGLSDQGILNWAMEQGRPMTLPITHEDLQPFPAGATSPDIAEGHELFAIAAPMVRRSGSSGVAAAITTREPNQQEISLIGILTSEMCLLYSQMMLNQEVLRGRDRLGRIMSSLVDGVISTDSSERVAVVTPAAEKILGIDATVARGVGLEEAMPKGLAGFMKNLAIKAAARSGPAVEEFEIRGAKSVPVSVTCSPLAPAGEKILGTEDGGNLFVVRDISESRELQKLRDLARMKDEFISNVSHELKTPLTSIIAYAEILINEFADLAETGIDTESSRDFVQIIIKEANRLKDMINEILDLQRLETGRLDFKMQVMDLSELVSECCRILDSTAAENKSRIVESLPSSGPYMEGDRDKIKQAFINVIGNSIKYSPEGGDVEVSISVGEGNAEVTVRDHGIGISAEDLPKVFEKFFRADNSLTYEIGGTGLGLSIVKGIIEAHGGRVSLDSVLGAGTSFAFTLPVREVTECEMPKRQEKPQEDDPLAGLFD